MKQPMPVSWSVAFVGLLLSSFLLPSRASIAINSNTTYSEYALFILDRDKQVSYILDLGLDVEAFADGVGQSDAGYQQFWTINRTTDTAFNQLRNRGSAVSSLEWAVVGIDADGGGPTELGAYITLRQGDTEGVRNPNYTRLIQSPIVETTPVTQEFGTFLLNNNFIPNSYNTMAPANDAQNGSAFWVDGDENYFADGDTQWANFGPTVNLLLTNFVGKSSWFYQVRGDADETVLEVAVDEFDNLYADGYWGLAENPADDTFVLSYTLTGAPSAEALAFRRAIGRTEVNSGFRTRALAALADDPAASTASGLAAPRDVADERVFAAMSPVPEPSSWALMAAGSLLLAAAATRRKR